MYERVEPDIRQVMNLDMLPLRFTEVTHTPMWESIGFGEDKLHVFSSRPTGDLYELSFEYRASYYSKQILRWASSCRGRNIGILGPGWLCSNCGDYNPSGCAICLKCGGEAEEEFLKPMRFPFRISLLESLGCRNDEPERLLGSMVGHGDECVDAIFAIAQGNAPFWCSYSLDGRYYLCKYCGQAVQNGKVCPGCGGKRMPFQEILSLNRDCIFCGEKVKGGIICTGCGARIRGLTFKQYALEA